VASHWVRAEATIAHRARTLLPATIEPCDKPVMFELTQTAELSHWRGEADDTVWQAFLADARRMVGREAPSTAKPAPTPEKPTASGGMPIVAVLPLQCRSGDETMDRLAEDLTEEITRELSQSCYCKVIAASTTATLRGRAAEHGVLRRELGARYAVEGRLHGSGENARMLVQLIDTGSDGMLWSSRFAGKRSEIEEAPEQFARSVAVELDQTIGQLEVSQALAKRGPCSAWEHVMRARALMSRQGPGNARRAEEEARCAVSALPDYGLAYATLANALGSRLQVDRLLLAENEAREIIREARDLTTRAMELDGYNPAVLCSLSMAYGCLGDAEAALGLALRAAKLAPVLAEAQFALGLSNFMLGRTAEAIAALDAQDGISLTDNARMAGLAMLGICHFMEGRSPEAEAVLDRSMALQPSNFLALRWKAIAAADQGKEESARAAVRLLRAFEPGKSTDEYLDSPKHLPVEHPRKYEAIAILRRLLDETEDEA
jgi:TolB-like protein